MADADPKYLPGTQLWVDDGTGRQWPAVVMEYSEYDAKMVRETGMGDICISFYHSPKDAVPLDSHGGNCSLLEFTSAQSQYNDAAGHFQRAMANAKLDRAAAARRAQEASENIQRPWAEDAYAGTGVGGGGGGMMGQLGANPNAALDDDGFEIYDPALFGEPAVPSPRAGGGGGGGLEEWGDYNPADFGDDVVITGESDPTDATTGVDLGSGGHGEFVLSSADQALAAHYLSAVRNPDEREALRQLVSPPPEAGTAGTGRANQRRKRSRDREDENGRGGAPAAPIVPPSAGPRAPAAARRQERKSQSPQVLADPPAIPVQLRTGWEEESLAIVQHSLFNPDLQMRSHENGMVDRLRDSLPLPALPKKKGETGGGLQEFGVAPTLGPQWELVSVLGAASIQSMDADFAITVPTRGDTVGLQSPNEGVNVLRGDTAESQYFLVPLLLDTDKGRAWLGGEEGLKMRAGVKNGNHSAHDKVVAAANLKNDQQRASVTLKDFKERQQQKKKEKAKATKKKRKGKNWGKSSSDDDDSEEEPAGPEDYAQYISVPYAEAIKQTSEVPKPWHLAAKAQSLAQAPPKHLKLVEVTGSVKEAVAQHKAGSNSRVPLDMRIAVRFTGSNRALSMPDEVLEENETALFHGVIALVEARRRSDEQLMQWVEENQANFSSTRTRGRSVPLSPGGTQGGASLVSANSVKPKCAYSLKPLEVPCRGEDCVQDCVVDLSTIIKKGLESGVWRCPLCHMPTPLQKVKIYSEMRDALNIVRAEFPDDKELEDVKAIISVGTSVAIQRSSSMNAENPRGLVGKQSSIEVVSATLGQSTAGGSGSFNDTICLDDDDEF